jgi:hypothetical protein
LHLLNADDAAVQLCPVDAFHGVLRLDVRAHRHERKAPGVTGPWVAHLGHGRREQKGARTSVTNVIIIK